MVFNIIAYSVAKNWKKKNGSYINQSIRDKERETHVFIKVNIIV